MNISKAVQGWKYLQKNTYTKTDRLLKRPDFIRLSKFGKKIHSNHFIASVDVNELEQVRLGITVTKKVGVAVKRNRLKRLVREYFRLNRQAISGNRDINIIAKKGSAELTTAEVFTSLQDIFDKVARKYDN